MDVVERYRLKRIARMEQRYGRFHGVRFDADDENNNKSGKSGGGHGNTRIPYGLCQREGINIEKDWTPSDAWKALEGKGYSASGVYKELKSTGRIAPKKPKIDKKQLEQTVKEYKSRGKTLKALEKERDQIQNDYDTARFAFSKMAGNVSKTQEEITALEKDAPGYYDPGREEYQKKYEELHSRLRNQTQKANEYYEERTEAKKKLDEKNAEINRFNGEEQDAQRKYREAMQSIVDDSPFKDKVQQYREMEHDLESAKSTRDDIEKELNKQKSYESQTLEIIEAGGESAREFYGANLQRIQGKIQRLQEKKSPLDDRISQLEGSMGGLKDGINEKDWKQIHDYAEELDTVPESKYDSMQSYVDSMRKNNVKYQNLRKFIKQPSEEEIIDRLGGGDETGGSCATLALCYAANKAGYDVLDFRGGMSRKNVSRQYDRMIKSLGGKSGSGSDDYTNARKLLDTVEEGKEYCFSAGSHAAVIRKREGKLEYLELQSTSGNGWHSLDDNVLKKRFGCKTRRTTRQGSSTLIETGAISGNQEVISYLGYANTSVGKQKKGKSGGIK